MASNRLLADGAGLTPFEIGPKRWSYPFAQNGDVYSSMFEQDYWQIAAGFYPVTRGSPHPILRDFYAANETPASLVNGLVHRFTRTYARIPAMQETWTTIPVNKPSVPDANAGGQAVSEVTGSSDTAALVGTGAYYSNHIWTPGNEFYGPLKAGTPSRTLPSGGTFTLTYKASTTGAIAYNAAAGTINTAINGLADVISDGLTFTSTNNLTTTGGLALLLSAGTTTSRVTMDASSLTAAAANKAFTYIQSTTVQACQIAYRVAITSHGFNASNALMGAVSNGATYIVPATTHWASISANEIAVDAQFFTASFTVWGQYLRDYTPGSDRVTARDRQSFYLPGVTAGITTPADIPVPDPLIGDAAFLAAVLANPTGWVTYDAEALGQWLGGPIYQQSVRAINMGNV